MVLYKYFNIIFERAFLLVYVARFNVSSISTTFLNNTPSVYLRLLPLSTVGVMWSAVGILLGWCTIAVYAFYVSILLILGRPGVLLLTLHTFHRSQLLLYFDLSYIWIVCLTVLIVAFMRHRPMPWVYLYGSWSIAIWCSRIHFIDFSVSLNFLILWNYI
jgi:hypothetical protein